jgi:hypothetical protein
MRHDDADMLIPFVKTIRTLTPFFVGLREAKHVHDVAVAHGGRAGMLQLLGGYAETGTMPIWRTVRYDRDAPERKLLCIANNQFVWVSDDNILCIGGVGDALILPEIKPVI